MISCGVDRLRLIRLHGGEQSLQEQDLVLAEVVRDGVIQRGCDDQVRGLASDHGDAAGGGFGVLFPLIGFGDHEHIIGAVICAQSIGGDIGVHDRVNHPAIGQPDANADDDSGDDRDPVR